MSGERAWIILGPDCYDSPGLSGIDDTLRMFFLGGVCILLLKDVRYAQISCQSCLSEPVLGEERLTWFGLVKG